MQIIEQYSDRLIENLDLILTVVAILILTVFLAWVVRRAFDGFIERSTQELNNDSTNYRFMSHLIIALIYVAGFSFAVYLIPFLKHIATSMMGAAGILAIAIGFASQQALGNIVSGLFIVIYKPYKINDRVTLQTSIRGVVEDINLRHTIIRNFENQRIIIPNSVMSNEILMNSNYTDDKICRFIEIGISYGSDLDRAKEIMIEEVMDHPDYLDVRETEDIEKGAPPVRVRVLSLGDSSVVLRAWAWAEEPQTAFFMSCDLIESIKKRFDKEGIVIPFPQRTLSYLDPIDSRAGKRASEVPGSESSESLEEK
ncbi:MAG: mechanosensitive ion channel family protein [Balneolaceae bacterium]